MIKAIASLVMVLIVIGAVPLVYIEWRIDRERRSNGEIKSGFGSISGGAPGSLLRKIWFLYLSIGAAYLIIVKN